LQNILVEMLNYVIGSLAHNSLYLFLGILIAVAMKVYIDPEKIKQILLKKSNASIPASVAFGAFTPLCACGTMAVIIAMLTTALPWGPIMAFLTSSPLMSPDGFILIAGIINVKFAIALALASVIIGLSSGYITNLIEKKTNFLSDQVRFSKKPYEQSCGCSKENKTQVQTCGCARVDNVSLQLCCSNQASCSTSIDYYQNQFPAFLVYSFQPIENLVAKFSNFAKKIKLHEIVEGFVNIGVKQILVYYSIFVAIGFLINRFVPAEIIVALFSAKNIFAVPLAALIGLPIYVNGESAIPLINSLMASGASGGAMLAFLITGPGTSAGVIAGIATIMKKRALTLYVMYLLFGGIILGYLYNMFLAMGV
jgi:uncharacterized protein